LYPKRRNGSARNEAATEECGKPHNLDKVNLPTLKVQHILRFRFAGLLSLEQSKFGTIKANVEKVEYKG
jgi:hypothetical protein